jgi:hypothetical protein
VLCLKGATGGSKIEFHHSDGSAQISATGDDASNSEVILQATQKERR